MDDPLVHEISQTVIGIFQKPFRGSFNEHCVLWLERKEEHEHPLASEDRSNLQSAVVQIVENGHTQQLMDSLLQRIEDFILNDVVHIIQNEDSDIFLDRFIQFEEYIRKIDEWISEDFQPAVGGHRRRQAPSRVACIDKARKTCFDYLVPEQLAWCCLNRITKFRDSVTFSYNSPWIFLASSMDPISTVTEYFEKYCSTDFMEHKWITPYYAIVKNHVEAVSNGLPQHYRERDFYALVYRCIRQESYLFGKVAHVSPQQEDGLTQRLYTIFCIRYDSEVQAGNFMAVADMLIAPEPEFDEILFSGLTKMYSCSSDDKNRMHIELKKGIKANYGKWVLDHHDLISTEASNSPLESIIKLVEELEKFRDKLAKRLEAYMYKPVGHAGPPDIVSLLLDGNFFKQISDEGIVEKVNQISV